jgi:hypothetical protein
MELLLGIVAMLVFKALIMRDSNGGRGVRKHAVRK